MDISIAFSEFARSYSKKEMGHSYSSFTEDELLSLVRNNWNNSSPGTGEIDCSRKRLVSVPADGFYCPDRADLKEKMKVEAKITSRQKGEDLYVENYVSRIEAERCNALIVTPASSVDIVCYSSDALLENGGTRSSNADWEIVTILCHENQKTPMLGLTMARNFLEKSGGTKSVYTAREFAESIWYHSNRRGIKVLG